MSITPSFAATSLQELPLTRSGFRNKAASVAGLSSGVLAFGRAWTRLWEGRIAVSTQELGWAALPLVKAH